VHYLSTWPEVNEDEIAQVNIRFPNEKGRHYQFESVLQCGIAPSRYAYKITGDKFVKPLWRWKQEPDRFKDVHDVLADADAELSNAAFVSITVPKSLGVGGQVDMDAIDDESCPFADPYYWAGWIVTGDVVPDGGGAFIYYYYHSMMMS
jgi:hypothetical protein